MHSKTIWKCPDLRNARYATFTCHTNPVAHSSQPLCGTSPLKWPRNTQLRLLKAAGKKPPEHNVAPRA